MVAETPTDVKRTAMPTNGTLTDDQIELIRRTVLKPRTRKPTEDELALFVHQCERTALDPFAGQIYAMYRRDKRTQGEVMKVQASIDGLRLIAQRTGEYTGQDGPYWCDSNAEWSDVWLKGEPPTAARVGVGRRGFKSKLYAVSRLTSYAQCNQSGQPTGTWAQMPEVMIAKVAEGLALRRAFPAEMSGLYSPDELPPGELTTSAKPLPDEMLTELRIAYQSAAPGQEVFVAKLRSMNVSASMRWSEIQNELTVEQAQEIVAWLKERPDRKDG